MRHHHGHGSVGDLLFRSALWHGVGRLVWALPLGLVLAALLAAVVLDLAGRRRSGRGAS